MATDKPLLIKSLKYFMITGFCMFLAPIILNQAFKNQGHEWFWPVCIIGVLVALIAIGMGFYSVKTIMRALFGPSKK
jgi:hypothetical protein